MLISDWTEIVTNCEASRRWHGGVGDETRTRDRLDHNQELYQLSYTHHRRPVDSLLILAERADQAEISVSFDAEPSRLPVYLAAMARAVSLSGPGAGTNTASR